MPGFMTTFVNVGLTPRLAGGFAGAKGSNGRPGLLQEVRPDLGDERRG